MLRERIYGAIACLSALLILVRHDSPDFTPSAGAIDLAVDACALWAASLFADYVSDVAAQGHPNRSKMTHGLRVLARSWKPSLCRSCSSCWRAWASCRSEQPSGPGWITVVVLGLFAWLAARRLPVLNGQRAALVLVLLALGALVVAVKTLAH